MRRRVKPEVLKSWSLEIDYSRALCLGADQKARGLWERDWFLRNETKSVGNILILNFIIFAKTTYRRT